MQRSHKIDSLILIRSIAILLVVLGHATRNIEAPNPHMYSPMNIPQWEIIIKRYIYSFHMPLFFWISGFAFYYSSVEMNKHYLFCSQIIKKIKRLIIPMYSTSFLVLLPTILFFGNINGTIINQIKLFLLGFNIDHLWFLRTLFIIFLFITFIVYWLKYNNSVFYIMAIIILGVLLSYRPSFFNIVSKETYDYFIFFIVGCLSRKYERTLLDTNVKNAFVICFVSHLLIFTMTTKNILKINTSILWYFLSLSGIFFTYFFSILTVSFLKKNKIWFMLTTLDKKSYSIYLFHVSFLYIVLYLNNYTRIEVPVLRIILSFLSGIFLPMIIHDLFSKNKILAFLFSVHKNPKIRTTLTQKTVRHG